MTALVAIENCSLDKIFTTSENATRFLEEGSGELELKTGETMDFILYYMVTYKKLQ